MKILVVFTALAILCSCSTIEEMLLSSKVMKQKGTMSTMLNSMYVDEKNLILTYDISNLDKNNTKNFETFESFKTFCAELFPLEQETYLIFSINEMRDGKVEAMAIFSGTYEPQKFFRIFIEKENDLLHFYLEEIKDNEATFSIRRENNDLFIFSRLRHNHKKRTFTKFMVFDDVKLLKKFMYENKTDEQKSRLVEEDKKEELVKLNEIENKKEKITLVEENKNEELVKPIEIDNKKEDKMTENSKEIEKSDSLLNLESNNWSKMESDSREQIYNDYGGTKIGLLVDGKKYYFGYTNTLPDLFYNKTYHTVFDTKSFAEDIPLEIYIGSISDGTPCSLRMVDKVNEGELKLIFVEFNQDFYHGTKATAIYKKDKEDDLFKVDHWQTQSGKNIKVIRFVDQNAVPEKIEKSEACMTRADRDEKIASWQKKLENLYNKKPTHPTHVDYWNRNVQLCKNKLNNFYNIKIID